MTFEHIQPCLADYGYITGNLFPTRDPDARTLYSMMRMTALVMVQVPTADMLVSTTLLIVMSTIWIQEQQLIFVSYSCYITLFLVLTA